MPEKNEELVRRPVLNLRTILYAIAFVLIFSLTCVELGLVSEQLHKYGDDYSNYGSKQYKHILGLLLFSVIVSLLVMLSHPFVGVPFITVCSLILAVFFGTAAGVIWQNTGLFWKGTGCRPAESIPENWRPFARECGRVVTIQAVAWSLFGLYILLFVGTLIHKLKIRARPTPEGFYYNV
ncbi:hypothetical protein FA13DRAFT_164644 [Coprinellus micaceus]|uniref:MARVEL domain-containing protein n=1 Tax=Coprinellus micaceus TaxID=71717 RepID=A0A4Y7SHG1_COPMI|nr:hypothetical protein FA13DRAFT_164644 [Coprinellus micaceus]